MRRYWLVFVVSFLAIAVVADSAQAYRYRRGYYSRGAGRYRSINSIRMQVAAFEAIARQADAVVAQNKGVVDSANARISEDREAMTTASASGKQADKDMAAAEEEMWKSADSDSDKAKIKEKYEEARALLQAEQTRVLNSPEYLAEIAKTKGKPEHVEFLPKVRAKYLDADEGYQRALSVWEAAHKAYSGEREESLFHDEHWLLASEDKRKSLAAAAKALNDSKAGGLKRLPAAVNMHQAQLISQQAHTYAAMGRAMLGAMGAGYGRGYGGRYGGTQSTPPPTFTSPGSN